MLLLDIKPITDKEVRDKNKEIIDLYKERGSPMLMVPYHLMIELENQICSIYTDHDDHSISNESLDLYLKGCQGDDVVIIKMWLLKVPNITSMVTINNGVINITAYLIE